MIKTTKYPFDTFDSKTVPVMAYVPRQGSPILNESLESGFINGTIFPELEKPLVGRRNCCS